MIHFDRLKNSFGDLCETIVPNVGIGTTNPGYKLDVNGAINASGDIGSSGAGTGVVQLTGGAAPAAPAAGVANVFVNTNGMLECQYGAGSSECIPTYNTANNAMGADVTMTLTTSWYDGPAVTLAVGTWMVQGTVTISTPSTAAADAITCKLWDGTTVASSTEVTVSATALAGVKNVNVSLQGIVSPAVSSTYKITCKSTLASNIIKAATVDNGVGNNASTLWAARLK